MWFRSLLAAPANNRAHRKPSRRSIRPILETLESRLTPTTQTFTPGDAAALISDLGLADAAPPNTITVINLQAGATYSLTQADNYWYGPNGLPPIDSTVIIHGNGATIQRDPGAKTPDFRLFYVSGGMELATGSLTMDNVTLEGGIAKGGDSNLGGGGFLTEDNGSTSGDASLGGFGGGGGLGGYGGNGGRPPSAAPAAISMGS